MKSNRISISDLRIRACRVTNKIKIEEIKEFARILKPNSIIGLTFNFGKTINAKSNYEYNDYDQFHTPIRKLGAIGRKSEESINVDSE